MEKKFRAILLVSASMLINPVFSFSQNIPAPADKKIFMHRERPDDKYLPYPAGEIKTSPARKMQSTAVFTTQVNVNVNGDNIIGDAANEPSIAVDPVNPSRILIGWRQFDNVSSNFRQAGYAYSADSGKTWTFPGVFEPGVFRSDPVLDSDSSGNLYYNSLTLDNFSGQYLCKVFKSSDGGNTWNAGVDAHGGDKQWMTIDKSGGIGSGNIYSFWTAGWSSCYPGFFTRSSDGGDSFEDCVMVDGSPYWGTMAVGPDGELYIAGTSSSDGILVAKSTSAQTPGSTINWNFSTVVDMDGYITGNLPINPVGILGQAYIDVDRSNGPGRGNVYVLASVVRLSNSDMADVMFSMSTNNGFSWSPPIRINDDQGTDYLQWFGTMSVAPNGRIDVVWLDTRDTPGTDLSALYYCYSTDQGTTWSANEMISDVFDPHLGYPQQDKMGDYFDMVSDETGAHLAWANTLNYEEDVYYSYIIPDVTGINDKYGLAKSISLTNYPNPFSDQTSIRYKTPVDGNTKIDICTITGEVVLTLINKYQKAGSYDVTITDRNLTPGFYFCRLNAGSLTKTIRLVKI